MKKKKKVWIKKQGHIVTLLINNKTVKFNGILTKKNERLVKIGILQEALFLHDKGSN